MSTQDLIDAITDPQHTKARTADLYSEALSRGAMIDWKRVNDAIMFRWSFNALQWIKQQAAARMEGK